MYSANLIFILSTICGTQAVEALSCVQKSKKHFKIWLRQTVTNASRDYHLSLHALGKVKTNRPRASQICIGVIIVLSIKTQSLCDVLIGRELNEITPTAIRRLDILWQTLGHRTSGDLLIFCGGSQNLDSCCSLQVFLRSLRRVSRKKLA